jgi:DNA/RNA-binding protein KIN17
MRDENGFKMHTQSEGHVRQMLVVGENAKKYINDYSGQFQRDFVQLLRTSHGEKKVHLNHFYQEYIGNKEHVHMNSTKWPSLMDFGKFLGREGICRVEEDEKGIWISWVDNSPENLRRQDAIRKKERQDKGDEEREQAAIREQVKRAKMAATHRGEKDFEDQGLELKREEGEKVKLSFGAKPAPAKADTPVSGAKSKLAHSPSPSLPTASVVEAGNAETSPSSEKIDDAPAAQAPPEKVALKMGFSSKPKNVFAVAKKNALGGGKKAAFIEQPKKMSEAERIMKEEMERKRSRGPSGFGGPPQKKPRF